MSEEFLWVERYRPKTIGECILPKSIKDTLQSYVDSGKIPNLLFEGPPGTGKTTAAKAMCEQIGVDYLFINASSNRGIDMMRTDIIDFASTMSLNGKGKCIIMDEADYLTPEAQAAFRGIPEEFSGYCSFILTCNYKSKLMGAIDSRMAEVSFYFDKSESDKMKSQMFLRIIDILGQEGIQYDEKPIARIIDKYYPDFRKTLGELQKFTRSGKFTEDILPSITGTSAVDELVKHMKAKNFTKARQWIADHPDLDGAMIYRKIYDSAYEYFTKDSIPMAVLLVGKYSYQHPQALDPEINLAAFVVEIMVECTFQ